MINSFESFDLAEAQEWREIFIRAILRITSFSGILLLLISLPSATPLYRMIYIVLFSILLTITLLQTPYKLRAYVYVSITVILGMITILNWGPWSDGATYLLTAAVLASLLFDNRTDWILLGLSILFTSSVAYLDLNGGFSLLTSSAPPTSLFDWSNYIADFSVASIILVAAINMFKSALFRLTAQLQQTRLSMANERGILEDKIAQKAVEMEARLSQLETSGFTARTLAASQTVNELLQRAVDLISEQFDFYHVGIIILDEQKKNGVLLAASSDTGKAIIGYGHRIDSDKNNPLAMVVGKQMPFISHDLDRAKFIPDQNFPLTRSRLILPLLVRGVTIGLIDIHSDQPNAISSQTAEIIQIAADMIAISFENLRLVGDSKKLAAQLESGSLQQTERAWSKFTNRQKNAYVYTPAGVRPVFAEAAQDPSDGLRLPIRLHGKEIGKITLKKRKESPGQWSERERIIIEKISSQVALALDNSRLIDEAQRNAVRNQMIANFSTYVRETLDVEAVVRTAATELRKVFDLKEAEIVIGQKQTQGSPPSQEILDKS